MIECSLAKFSNAQLGDHFRRPPVRLVVDAQAAFFLHRLALVVDVLLRDRRRPHAIGLEKQHHVELVRRHLLEVDRVILVGLPVVVAAVVLDEAGELAVGDVLRALEHQVLEQVREAGAALAARFATRRCRPPRPTRPAPRDRAR